MLGQSSIRTGEIVKDIRLRSRFLIVESKQMASSSAGRYWVVECWARKYNLQEVTNQD